MTHPERNLYLELATALENAGLFATFQGTFLSCCSKKFNSHLGGTSICILLRDKKWYLDLWGDEIVYEVPAEQNIVEVVLNVLGTGYNEECRIPKAIVDRFQLATYFVDDETGEIGSEIL